MGSKFRVEMQVLMDELLGSECHFIRYNTKTILYYTILYYYLNIVIII